jgi:hypothetical protein
MIGIRRYRKGCGVRRTFLVVTTAAFFSTAALGASDITGSARNESRGQPAVGDKVILIRLDRGIQEEARAKTGPEGAFTLHVRQPGKPYLVRVVHDGVAYDQRASAGDNLSIPVFDAAPQVARVRASIEILRAGTNGNLLHISDMYELKNESSPPVTQASGQTFEVYLPGNAKIDSVLAAGPAKIGVMISADAVPGEPGHYTVNYPLRPGETKFAFNYDLPYDGRAVFQTRLAYPVQQLAVMIPPNMKFSSRSRAFKLLATGRRDYQVQAANQLEAGVGPGFEISGTGALPPLGDQAKTQARALSLAAARPTVPAGDRAVMASFARVDSRSEQSQSLSQLLVLIGVTAVLLAACALLIWRVQKTRRNSAA